MAFTSTIIKKYIFGNRCVHVGSWDATGVTGGDIDTGLKRVEMCSVEVKSTATSSDTNPVVVNETFPLASGSVTIVCDSGAAGYFTAYGIRG